MRSLYTVKSAKLYADPEYKLLAAVALSAIDDLRWATDESPRKKTSLVYEHAAAAREWLAGADAPITFRDVASAVGVEDHDLSDQIAARWDL